MMRRFRLSAVAAMRASGVLLSALTLLLAVSWGSAARADEDYLEPDVAFKFSARMQDAGTIAVTYAIADGYYMYRERFAFTAAGAKLGAPQIPPGKVKFDETFQKNVETYRHAVTILIPVEATDMFTLSAKSQGCADKGLCYAPQEAQARLMGSTLQAAQPVVGANVASASAPVALGAPEAVPVAAPVVASSATGVGAAALTGAPVSGESGNIETALKGGRLLVIVPLFLLLGLGLAFTPCVLPMVPILSFIIVGEGARATRGRSLVLSISYALGMAIVYTALGVAAGLAGEGLAAALQNPWILGTFGVLMVALSLSMFGFYELQLPGVLQTKLAGVSGKQSGGKLAGVFVMGALSALIVGPCVAAPLAGALVYISQTRDVVIGGSALFAMAIGMSVPLLLVGVSAGSLLPRAGAWMDGVKRFFGVLMLAMALWLVAPVLPPVLHMLGWSALLLGYGFYLRRANAHWSAMALGSGLALLGAVQLVGVATGARDPFAPMAHLRGAAQASLQFSRIKTSAQLDAALAASAGRTVMLDFYADWCVACKEMEKFTFSEPSVRDRLANTVMLQVDVTANDADDKALLKRFNLFGPPGIILFDGAGQEIPGSRVIGYQDSVTFLASLSRLK